jgi:3-hydroxyacyl-CoA dehydrogenase
MSDSFKRDFLITHFFNLPRYMRLLEVVRGALTRADAAQEIEEFCDVQLGKGVVQCKDTPGFIGNRIGIYWIQCAVMEAMQGGLSVEEADAVTGRPMGAPKTGVFGLSDLVGLDLLPHVLESMNAHLDADDAFHEVSAVPDVIQEMISSGYTGRKGKGGFYRLSRDGAKRVKDAKDLETGVYRAAGKPRFDSVAASRKGGLRALFEHPDKGGQYAWRVVSRTLSYAAELVPEIANNIVAVDEAMRLGFNWDRGPFEMIDSLGTAWFLEKLEAQQLAVPPLLKVAAGRPFYRIHEGGLEFMEADGSYSRVSRAPGVALLADIKRATKPLRRSAAASAWDIGDGVVCLEFHTKMNALDTGVMEMIRQALELVEKDDSYVALVIHNEAPNFSVGANIGMALFAINIAAWPAIEAVVRDGQSTTQAIRQAPFPVVGAPSGMALGGGCEVLLHCDAVQAHAECYMGLVEVGVGLIPGWGGCKEMLQRWCRGCIGRCLEWWRHRRHRNAGNQRVSRART